MNSGSLPFDTPPQHDTVPYQRKSATSKAAAIKAKSFIGEQGKRVLSWFQQQGVSGATQRQASEALGISRASMCARVNALESAGQLVKTARRQDGCQIYRSKF